jgi:hypothetical protein
MNVPHRPAHKVNLAGDGVFQLSEGVHQSLHVVRGASVEKPHRIAVFAITSMGDDGLSLVEEEVSASTRVRRRCAPRVQSRPWSARSPPWRMPSLDQGPRPPDLAPYSRSPESQLPWSLCRAISCDIHGPSAPFSSSTDNVSCQCCCRCRAVMGPDEVGLPSYVLMAHRSSRPSHRHTAAFSSPSTAPQ